MNFLLNLSTFLVWIAVPFVLASIYFGTKNGYYNSEDYDGDGCQDASDEDLDDDNDGIPDDEDDTANPPRGPFNVIGAGDFIFDLPDAASKLISRLLYSSNPDDYLPDNDDGMNP